LSNEGEEENQQRILMFAKEACDARESEGLAVAGPRRI
jgi:hypothetical protein